MKKRDQRKLRNSPLTYEWYEPEEVLYTGDMLMRDMILTEWVLCILRSYDLPDEYLPYAMEYINDKRSDEERHAERAVLSRSERKHMRKLLRQIKHKLGIPKSTYKEKQ